MRKMLCLAVVALAAAASASAAGADSGMTMTFGSPKLSASHVAITVPVTVSCAPFDPSFVLTQSISVSVEQGSGTGIAFGSASLGENFFPDGNPIPAPCDGATHTLTLTVFANTSGRPFHGGPATFSGSGLVIAWQSCGFPGCFTQAGSESAQAGPTTVPLR